MGLNDPGAEFNQPFFEGSPNILVQILPSEAKWETIVRVIDIPLVAAGAHLELVMNGEAETALAFLSPSSRSP